jgi:RNA polymerase sigma-70 factor (ECF subfamily)
MTELAALYRDEHARVLASVLARVSDWALAEEAVQDAFVAAAEQWRDATPVNPRAWLIRVASNKAIDRMRRRSRFPEVELVELEADARVHDIRDERLRLICTCCHPAIAPEARVALTLRAVAGLATDEIARLFVTEPAAMAQRLVRTQRKIRDARIPYAVPDRDKLGERIAAVLAVIYLVFTEGHAPTAGDAPVRGELCDEAIRLGRLVVELVPDEPEARSLLALMLFHDARRASRVVDGELVLLDEQDRARWDAAKIGEAHALLDGALAARAHGPYALQASIAALHARAASPADTDWPQIVEIYELLAIEQPTAIVELNRAVAVAMARGPEAGLAALDRLRFALDGDHLFHAARGDLYLRLDRRDDAARAFRAAIARAGHPAEKRLLERRLALARGPVRDDDSAR